MGAVEVDPGFFRLSAEHVRARPGRRVHRDLLGYMRQDRERNLRVRSPVFDTLSYMSRHSDLEAARAEVVYHTFRDRGSGLTSAQLWLDNDRANRRRDGEYKRNSGALPRLGVFITASFPRSVEKSTAVAALNAFLDHLGGAFGVAAEAVLHRKGPGVDHAHIFMTDRFVDGRGVGSKNRLLNGIAAKASGAGVVDGDAVLAPAMESMRSRWAELMREIAPSGTRPIDHRSFDRRGIDLLPVHIETHAVIRRQKAEGHERWRRRRRREMETRGVGRQHPVVLAHAAEAAPVADTPRETIASRRTDPPSIAMTVSDSSLENRKDARDRSDALAATTMDDENTTSKALQVSVDRGLLAAAILERLQQRSVEPPRARKSIAIIPLIQAAIATKASPTPGSIVPRSTSARQTIANEQDRGLPSGDRGRAKDASNTSFRKMLPLALASHKVASTNTSVPSLKKVKAKRNNEGGRAALPLLSERSKTLHVLPGLVWGLRDSSRPDKAAASTSILALMPGIRNAFGGLELARVFDDVRGVLKRRSRDARRRALALAMAAFAKRSQKDRDLDRSVHSMTSKLDPTAPARGTEPALNRTGPQPAYSGLDPSPPKTSEGDTPLGIDERKAIRSSTSFSPVAIAPIVSEASRLRGSFDRIIPAKETRNTLAETRRTEVYPDLGRQEQAKAQPPSASPTIEQRLSASTEGAREKEFVVGPTSPAALEGAIPRIEARHKKAAATPAKSRPLTQREPVVFRDLSEGTLEVDVKVNAMPLAPASPKRLEGSPSKPVHLEVATIHKPAAAGTLGPSIHNKEFTMSMPEAAKSAPSTVPGNRPPTSTSAVKQGEGEGRDRVSARSPVRNVRAAEDRSPPRRPSIPPLSTGGHQETRPPSLEIWSKGRKNTRPQVKSAAMFGATDPTMAPVIPPSNTILKPTSSSSASTSSGREADAHARETRIKELVGNASPAWLAACYAASLYKEHCWHRDFRTRWSLALTISENAFDEIMMQAYACIYQNENNSPRETIHILTLLLQKENNIKYLPELLYCEEAVKKRRATRRLSDKPSKSKSVFEK